MWTECPAKGESWSMASTPSGHIEQLPSGSYRAKLYAGTDPLTGKEIRFRETCKDYASAQVALGKFIEKAMAGREPAKGATVAKLLEVYSGVAEWDVSTRDSFEGYIRRVINPPLGHLQVRQVHGPILDTLYSRLKKCGDLTCTGRPFTEHRNVPDLRPGTANKKTAWKLVAGKLRDAITSGELPAGADLPSVRDLYEYQGIPMATGRRVFAELAEEGLIVVRHGRTATVKGEPEEPDAPGVRRWRPSPGHDCKLAGCQRHVVASDTTVRESVERRRPRKQRRPKARLSDLVTFSRQMYVKCDSAWVGACGNGDAARAEALPVLRQEVRTCPTMP